MGQLLSFQSRSDVELFVRMLDYARQSQETNEPILALFKNEDGSLNLQRMLDTPAFSGFEK